MPISFRYLLSGAGSRKTTRLCGRALAYLAFPGHEARPEDLLLTTFSREAANQLLDRLRLRILRAPGLGWHKKQELLDGLDRATINTNHAIGLAAFRDHWIELGHPPTTEVIKDEDRRMLVFEAMQSAGLPAAKRLELQQRAERLGRSDGQYRDRHAPKETVSSDVLKLVDIKERSGLTDTAFVQACVASIDGILTVLAAQRAACGLTRSMADVVAAAAAVEPAIADDVPHYATGATSITKKAHDRIRGFLRQRTWSNVLPLATLNAHKKSERAGHPAPHDRLDPLRQAAENFHLFNDFEDDLRRYVELAAELAAAGHTEYHSLLQRSGCIDYMSMERALANLRALGRPWDSFCEGFGFVGIDEAQDMTPEWTDIFHAITENVQCGIWIADPNQSIHNFRGADHKTVDAAAQALCTAIPGGREIASNLNFRSMKGIVGFVNHFFEVLRDPQNGTATRLPAQHAQQISLSSPSSPGRIERWQLGTSNLELSVAKVADEVHRLVHADGHAEHEICVMMRTNTHVRDMAKALKAVGLQVAMPPTDLLVQRESQVILAGLQLLIDPRDPLAAAKLHLLLDGASVPAGQQPEAALEDWLVERLIHQMKTRGLPVPAVDVTPKTTPRWFEAIKAASAAGIVSTLSPLSAVLLVIEATGLVSRVAQWDEPIRRQSHIDAMIRVARGFEETDIAAGRAPTVAAFAATCADRAEIALKSANRSRQDDDDYDDRPVPADVPGVRVMTYHATKGLGFPVTILADFGVSDRIDSPFEIRLAQSMPHVWPDPFGLTPWTLQSLTAIAKSLPIGKVRADEKIESLAQLLYVAMTRAKGLLVFAHGTKANDTEWFTRILGQVMPPSPAPAAKPARAKKAAAKKASRAKKKDEPDSADGPAAVTVSASATGSTPIPVGSPPSPLTIDAFLPPSPVVKSVPVTIGGVAGAVALWHADYEYRDFRVPPTPLPAAAPGLVAAPSPAAARVRPANTYADPEPNPAPGPPAGSPTGSTEVITGSTIRLLGHVTHAPRYESPSGNLHAIGSWEIAPEPFHLSGVTDLVTGSLRGAAGNVADLLGNAFHAFMAAVPSLPPLPTGHATWLRVAQRCLDGHLDAARQNLIAAAGVDAKVFVSRASAFADWVRHEFGVEPSGWIVEAPVAGPASVRGGVGGLTPSASTMWRGRVDLVITAAKGDLAGRRVLIDHKAVLTDRAGCVNDARHDFLGEVSAYADAMGNDAPAEIFVHFALAGSVVRIHPT